MCDAGVIADLSSESISARVQSIPAQILLPVRSDLDLWLNSTPFWCKNNFCSLKTEGVTNIFLHTEIFFLWPSIIYSVKASPTHRIMHNALLYYDMGFRGGNQTDLVNMLTLFLRENMRAVWMRTGSGVGGGFRDFPNYSRPDPSTTCQTVCSSVCSGNELAAVRWLWWRC